MFDRFIVASDYNRVSKRFNMAKLPDSKPYVPSYNINEGDTAYVINDPVKREIHTFQFGINHLGRSFPDVTCFVRAEGKRNLCDDPTYSGSKAIFLQPEFKSIIRTQRCLVLADAFVIGIESGKPHLVYLRDKKRPFAFAGIWTEVDGVKSFAIITVPANELMHRLGMNRMPVILDMEHEIRWIRQSSELSEVLGVLNLYPSNLMNAFPISLRIVDASLNDVSLVQPIGNPVLKEQNYEVSRKKVTPIRYNDDAPSWGESLGLMSE